MQLQVKYSQEYKVIKKKSNGCYKTLCRCVQNPKLVQVYKYWVLLGVGVVC